MGRSASEPKTKWDSTHLTSGDLCLTNTYKDMNIEIRCTVAGYWINNKSCGVEYNRAIKTTDI